MFPTYTARWKGIANGRTSLPEFSLPNMMTYYFVMLKICDEKIAIDLKHVENHYNYTHYLNLGSLNSKRTENLFASKADSAISREKFNFLIKVPCHFFTFWLKNFDSNSSASSQVFFGCIPYASCLEDFELLCSSLIGFCLAGGFPAGFSFTTKQNFVDTDSLNGGL